MSRREGSRARRAGLDAAEIGHLREAGRIVASVLDALEREVRPGITTGALDALAARLTSEAGARPAFLDYHGFPRCLCTSVNAEVVHGIPSDARTLVEGDLLKLDFGVAYRGLFADAARTVGVGRISPEAERLLAVTREALEAGIAQVRDGRRVGDIGAAISRHVRARGLEVVEGFTGHGIGRRLHEEPSIPNEGTAGSGARLHEGMAVCLEPMVSLGRGEVEVGEDDWTAILCDGSLGAHFEHTVLIGPRGPEVLTRGAGRRP